MVWAAVPNILPQTGRDVRFKYADYGNHGEGGTRIARDGDGGEITRICKS